jgi:hypothetical protein
MFSLGDDGLGFPFFSLFGRKLFPAKAYGT